MPATFPGTTAPIVKMTEDGERELVLRSWPSILLRSGNAPKRVTNTRDDKIENPLWQGSIKTRRCLLSGR